MAVCWYLEVGLWLTTVARATPDPWGAPTSMTSLTCIETHLTSPQLTWPGLTQPDLNSPKHQQPSLSFSPSTMAGIPGNSPNIPLETARRNADSLGINYDALPQMPFWTPLFGRTSDYLKTRVAAKIMTSSASVGRELTQPEKDAMSYHLYVFAPSRCGAARSQ